MKLSSDELKVIEPGIYRIETLSLEKNLGNELNKNCLKEIKNKLTRVKSLDSKFNLISDNSLPFRSFFTSIDEFLDSWMESYNSGLSQLGGSYNNISEDTLGFELYYTNWHKGSNFFKIPKDSGIDHAGINSINFRLNSIIICGDLNGLCDQNGYMNLGVNDFRNSKVLVYRKDGMGIGEGSLEPIVEENSIFKKNLTNDKKYYVWSGKDNFPFESPAPGKTRGYVWNMIGISPLEVYSKLSKLGFEFPK